MEMKGGKEEEEESNGKIGQEKYEGGKELESDQ